jgi:hypothetical protein
MNDSNSSQIHELIANLLSHKEFVGAVSKLLEAGLLEGIAAVADTKFHERLHRNEKQKQRLAEFAFHECGLKSEIDRFLVKKVHPSRLFFESGSTIAYIIGLFARKIREAKSGLLDSIVLTNNVLAIPALAGLAANVEPIQGRFEPTYYGFMPFRENEPQDSVRKKRETQQFDWLRDDIAACDRVYAACTEFSFLAGPLVGTRQNALTKRAMAAGMRGWNESDLPQKRYYLFLHFEKLLPTAPIIQDMAGALPLRGETESESPFSVFPSLESQEFNAMMGHWHADIAKWMKSNGTAIPPVKLDWHKKYFGSNAQIVKDATEFLNKSFLYYGRTAVNFRASWLEAGLDTRIVIALPPNSHDNSLKALTSEVQYVNELIGKTKIPRKFVFGLEAGNDGLQAASKTGVVGLTLTHA